MEAKYKICKVFDCMDMPDGLRSRFLRYNDEVCNDTFVDWEITDEEDYVELNNDDDYGQVEVWNREISEYVEEPRGDIKREIDKWLLGHGAESGEDVIIKHWW